jgi:hypothetical protein
MATVRELQGKARKLFNKWKKDYAKITDKDSRSPVSHLCMTVLMRNNNITNAQRAEQLLRKYFIDWNEIRVSPNAEIVHALQEADTPYPEKKASALKRLLADIFGKYTKTNLYFDLMDVPEVVPEPEPGEEPEPSEDDDEDTAVTRESGLPDHPEVPGYVDMERVMDQPVPLDPKLINEKNSIGVCGVTWDDAEKAPFAVMRRVLAAEGVLEPGLEGIEALQRLRQVGPDKDRDLFAFYAIVYAQQNWPRLSKAPARKKSKGSKKPTKSAKKTKAKSPKKAPKKKAATKLAKKAPEKAPKKASKK